MRAQSGPVAKRWQPAAAVSEYFVQGRHADEDVALLEESFSVIQVQIFHRLLYAGASHRHRIECSLYPGYIV